MIVCGRPVRHAFSIANSTRMSARPSSPSASGGVPPRNTIGEVGDLGIEMVDLRKLGLNDLSVAPQPEFRRRLEFEARIEFKIAERPDNPIAIGVSNDVKKGSFIWGGVT
jgi:hypothetical protein